jgi:hypothetical protein
MSHDSFKLNRSLQTSVNIYKYLLAIEYLANVQKNLKNDKKLFI